MNGWFEVAVSNSLMATVLAILAAAAARLGARPGVLHTLWLLVLLKLVTPPLISLPVARFQPVEPMSSVAWDGGPVGSLRDGLPAATMPTTGAATAIDPVAMDAHPEASCPSRLCRWFWHYWQPLLCSVWLVGSTGWIGVAASRVVRFQRWVGRTEPAPHDWTEQVAALASRFGLRACPEVRAVDAAIPPMAWALGRRTVLLLPKPLLTRLSEDERTALFTHELAHIRRGDPYFRWFEALVVGLYWWHPVAWIACRALRDAAERCCDAWVVDALPGCAHAYASTLFETATFLLETPCALPLGASGFGRAYPLSRRIEMIMECRTYRRLSGRTRGLAAVLLGAVLGVSPGIAPNTELLAGPPQTTGNVPAAEPAERQPKLGLQSPHRVATIDIAYLFKHYEKFGRELQAVRKDVEVEERKTKECRSRISELTQQYQAMKGDAPQRALTEQKVAAMQARL